MQEQLTVQQVVRWESKHQLICDSLVCSATALYGLTQKPVSVAHAGSLQCGYTRHAVAPDGQRGCCVHYTQGSDRALIMAGAFLKCCSPGHS